MWLYYLYDIWYVMHMLICSSPTITLCCSHLRWVGMPDMGRLGFSRWVTSKKSFNFFWISSWFAHHETKKWSSFSQHFQVIFHFVAALWRYPNPFLADWVPYPWRSLSKRSWCAWHVDGTLLMCSTDDKPRHCGANLYHNCHGSFSYVSLSYLIRDWILKMLLYPVQDQTQSHDVVSISKPFQRKKRETELWVIPLVSPVDSETRTLKDCSVQCSPTSVSILSLTLEAEGQHDAEHLKVNEIWVVKRYCSDW